MRVILFAVLMVTVAGAAFAQNVETEYNKRNYFQYDPAWIPPGASHQPGMAAPAAGDYVPPQNDLFKTSASGVAYATGGVGEEELEALKMREDEFNLKILSTIPTGQFVGTYAVIIRNSKGEEVFRERSNGPYFYVSLPAGGYTVEVDMPNQPMQSQKVTLGKNRRDIRFYWKVE